MNKGIHYILSVFMILGMVFYTLIPFSINKIDSLILLEKIKPQAFDIMFLAYNNYHEKLKENGGKEGYTLIPKKKDGFGEISPEDLIFCIKSIKNSYKDLKRISICFMDDTGVEIPVEDVTNSKYGIINDEGFVVNVESEIDASKSISSQIPAITTHIITSDKYNRLCFKQIVNGDGSLLIRPGGYVGIKQIWSNNDLISRVYLDAFGNPIEREDGYSEVNWVRDDKGTRNAIFYDLNGNEVSIVGRNLIKDYDLGYNEWSIWMTPTPNVKNCCFHIGEVNLGEKKKGDYYSCQVEVEYRNVSTEDVNNFRFRTQGAQDNRWVTKNVWGQTLIDLHEVPNDGIYTYTSTVKLLENMEGISTFNVDFRCDYWKGGSFRVRNVKIEKGSKITAWSPSV